MFNKTTFASMPQAQFAAIDLLNRPYLQHLSGQRLWSKRLQTYDAIFNDRHAIQTGFTEAPTIPGPGPCGADLVAAQPTLLEDTQEIDAESAALDAAHEQQPRIFSAPVDLEAESPQPKKQKKAAPKVLASVTTGTGLRIAAPKAKGKTGGGRVLPKTFSGPGTAAAGSDDAAASAAAGRLAREAAERAAAAAD